VQYIVPAIGGFISSYYVISLGKGNLQIIFIQMRSNHTHYIKHCYIIRMCSYTLFSLKKYRFSHSYFQGFTAYSPGFSLIYFYCKVPSIVRLTSPLTVTGKSICFADAIVMSLVLLWNDDL